MDRRWRAARDGGLMLVATAVAATWIAQRESSGPAPTRVTLAQAPTPSSEHIEFLVRGAGCAAEGDQDARKRVRKRVESPTLQYRDGWILVRFRLSEPPGRDACTGPDPGVPYSLTLVAPLGERVLYDANADPPTPIELENPR